MAKSDKGKRKVIVYGDEKQTIPVYIQDTRYRALKSLALQEGKPLNQFVRDIIEEVCGEELDKIEKGFLTRSDPHESTNLSSKAYERIAS